MKRLNLAILTSSLVLLVSGAALAEEAATKHLSNQQFGGQRPYMKAPTQENTYRADDQWEGATLVTDVNPDDKATNNGHAKHQPMRLHMLGKRPYIEHATD